jgi:hypothetical protein
MIFDDTDKNIPGSKNAPRLRQISGADVMITKLVMPPVSDSLVRKHIENGAVLYRVLSTKELKDISDGQLLANLSKMIDLGAKSYQCVLVIDTGRELLAFEDYVDKVDLWVDHGGTSIATYGHPISAYLLFREKKILEDKEKTSIVFPVYGSRKDIKLVKDWSATLATFPMLGYKGALIVREIINEKNLGDDLLTAILFLTDEAELEKSDGNWKKVRMMARSWLGLPTHFNLDIKYSGVEINDETDKTE